MKTFLFLLFILSSLSKVFPQVKTYSDSIHTHIKKYVKEHEVVTGPDKKYLTFFPADETFRIHCRFQKTENAPWFPMETSGLIKKNYRVYGTIHFSLNDTAVVLHIYQGQDLMTTKQYRDHLFIPFTDATSGEETYSGGRYFDLEINDILNGRVTIDFNKAYNPYCAYVAGKYNCPLPPAENHLPVAIRAGEKNYSKPH